MSKPNTVVRTSRSVIEGKLLTALQDENVCAALLTKDDLDTIIAALSGYQLGEVFGNVLSWEKYTARRKELAASLTQLRNEVYK